MTQQEIVLPETPEWDEIVSEINETGANHNWTIGDGALKICPIGQRGDKNGYIANLQKLADQTEIGLSKIMMCREASHAWSNTERTVLCAWSVYYILIANKDLIQPGMKVAEARALVAERNKPKPELKPEPRPEPKSEPRPKPKFELDPDDFKPKPDPSDDYNPKYKPDFNDEQHFVLMKAKLAGVVNHLNEALTIWGMIKNPASDKVDWVNIRIKKAREALDMLSMASNVTEDSLDNELQNLLGN